MLCADSGLAQRLEQQGKGPFARDTVKPGPLA